MAYLDRNLGVWRASDGTSGFGSQAAAEEYEATGVRPANDQQNDTSSYGDVYQQIVQRPTDAAQAQQTGIRDARQAQVVSDQQHNLRREYFQGSAPTNYGLSLDPSSAAQAGADQKTAVDAADKRNGGFVGDLGRIGAYVAGAAANPVGFVAGSHIPGAAQAVINPLGYATQQGYEQAAGLLPGGSGTGVGSSNPSQNGGAGAGGSYPLAADGIRTPARPSGGGTGAPTEPGAPAAGYAADAAGNATEREDDQKSLTDLYNDARYNGSEDARASRDQQAQALAKQSELYDLLSKFDPEAYQERASELALKNQLAIARSVPGGAAAAAEGLFNAQEQGAAISGEAERNADAMLMQRQQLAAQVTGQMGDLATKTRGQDVGEAQLQSEFGLRIADGVSQITGLDWQLDADQSKTLANIALALDAQDIDWARLDLDAQIAEADRVLGEAGLSQQWRIFKEGQKLSTKDLYGGLMAVLGTGMSGLFQIQAAKAGK